MTINQTLDQIFLSYQKKRMEQYPDVEKLKRSLIDLRIRYGGNTQVENRQTVENIIRFGSANSDNWE